MPKQSLHLLDADTPTAFSAEYAPLPGAYDEMMTESGEIRPHWSRFLAGLEALPAGELARRWRSAERLLHENGLTYSADVAFDGTDRPWILDFAPLLISAAEWRHLTSGLLQRARLLNMILADAYGEQKLLRDGHLPAAAVLGNSHFLRPCHGILPRQRMFLHLYAADLVRGPDGRWRVVSDRTQAPSGSGFALENRIVLSRCLPELFRDCQVHRLAAYFQSMHNSLVARTDLDNPRIVLMSEGPGHEGYFAHAYLARYLGYTLAEGADLTVRDRRVYLTTVDGLKPVDLILRRVDADACDPLELDAASRFGVAGLLQAARVGTVTLANALGSGLAETRAIMAFLPQLCRHLLGEELTIPNVETWWCGDPAGRRHALENLDSLVIDQAFRRRPMLSTSPGAILGSDLDGSDLEHFRQRLRQRGYDYAVQENIRASTAPSWIDGTLQPRPIVLRVFVAAKDDNYIVMPGGLTRMASSGDGSSALLHRGDSTKDTWVLSDDPVPSFSLLRTPLSFVEPHRMGKDLPSRAADNLFWLGRYAERTESLLRLLRTVLRRFAEDISPANDIHAMERVLKVLLTKAGINLAVVEDSQKGGAALERHVATLMFDPCCRHGLQETVDHLHRTAWLVRDRLSRDAWRTLRRFHTDLSVPKPRVQVPPLSIDSGETLELLDDAVRTLAAFSGMEMENMTRNYGWRFLDMGRRLERALHLTELLSSLLVDNDPEGDGSLIILLELADSFMTYRSRYLTTPLLAPVIDLLLLDESNPRSIAFQLLELSEHVEHLPWHLEGGYRRPEERVVLGLVTNIRLAEIASLCEQDGNGRRSMLARLLEQFEKVLPKLSEIIGRTYFTHAEVRPAANLIRRPPSK